nr:MAG TPA: hypothetical protein [Caudoviricetes sp.]
MFDLLLQRYIISTKKANCQLFMPARAYFCRVMTS